MGDGIERGYAMIIFGTKAKTQTLRTGKFMCPRCQQERAYSYKKAKRYFSIYFIPIIPLDDMGEFVECDTCGMTYAPEVLSMRVAKPQPDVARYLNSIKARLAQGCPLEYMVRDLTADGLDREIANTLVASAAGATQKRCPQCDLTYISEVTTCSECQIAL